MVDAYETVVSISFGIDFLTEAIVGPGFYISAENENIGQESAHYRVYSFYCAYLV